MDFEQEIRFALVMYGGVSLAIYMNGVTQEFFHLVRATAVDEPLGTEETYRELAGIVRARFIADIASGTSAGGINAIFLAKALANGQSLDQLAQLWLDEADLSELWNKARAPKSLLSGPVMYEKLSRALDGMDRAGGSGPLQPEMDVFITATDLQGLELPIELSDMTVPEKRYKNVFHLSFDTGGNNDFRREMNPFLAFAARATSSFPFAFEPMRLADAGESPDPGRFFPAYVSGSGADYSLRAFGDGGYLNNKPFSYAISELPRRLTEFPAQRKLCYIEPSPEQASSNATLAPPGVFRNSLDAAVTLHQYETIREDLQRVLDRNRLIERVREVAGKVEQDVEEWRANGRNPLKRLSGAEYTRRELADEIHDRGPGYAAYHRLKVRAVMDEMVRLMPQAREMFEQWRACSESRFLLDFDLSYRRRRLGFLLTKLAECPDEQKLRQELNRIAGNLRNTPAANGDPEELKLLFRELLQRAACDLETCLAGHPLKRFFDDYEYYDQVTFPILYETGVGDPDPVEVFRISPQDAHTLIDEQSPSEHRRKLAGTALFHFGAFLNRDWRRNDMLWGRLDGAERIITSISPRGSEHAARLIRKAHLAIILDTFGHDQDPEIMYQYLQDHYEISRKIRWTSGVKLACRAGWIIARMAAKRGRSF